jgi:hypothetical protein
MISRKPRNIKRAATRRGIPHLEILLGFLACQAMPNKISMAPHQRPSLTIRYIITILQTITQWSYLPKVQLKPIPTFRTMREEKKRSEGP